MSYSLQLHLTFPVVLWSRTLYPGWYFVSRISPHSPTDKKIHKLRTGKNSRMNKSNFKNIFCILFVILDFQERLVVLWNINFQKEIYFNVLQSLFNLCKKKKPISMRVRIPLRIPQRFWTFSDRCQNSFPVRISQKYGPAFLEPV